MSDTAVDVETEAGLSRINAVPSTAEYLQRMWDRRTFALEVPLEELRSAHKTTLLGNLWHLGNPLLTIAVYYLVFGTILGGTRPDNFLLWLTVGLFAFRYTQSSLTSAAKSLASNIGLIRAIRFPRALLPISSVASELMTFSLELSVLAVIVVLGGFGINRRWLFLPVIMVVHIALNLGGAFVVARLNDKFRDVQQILPFLFQLMRYLSGVMVPIDRFVNAESAPQIVRTLLSLNPLVPLINAYRWIFIQGTFDMTSLVRASIVSGLLLWFGFRYFRAAEWRYGLT